MYKIPSITLETLLFNLQGNQEVLVKNIDVDLTAYGNESSIRKICYQWLEHLVTSIFLNEQKQIEIHISNEL